MLQLSWKVLGNGGVVEQGNHESLLSKHGAYADMWEQQIRANRARSEETFDSPP